MDAPETIEPEQYFEKEYVIDEIYTLIIERNGDIIKYTLKNKNIITDYYYFTTGLYDDEIIRSLDNNIVNKECKIKDKGNEKILKISNKELLFNKKVLKDNEKFKLLYNEINKQKNEIDNLKQLNKNLEEKYNDLMEILKVNGLIKIPKNEINLIYQTKKEGEERIFGNIFVENNKNNIDLYIND